MKKFASNLFFNESNKLVCKGKNGKSCPVFKKQGSLDGACATYSVVMNLLILGVISDTDTRISVEYKNKDIKKLFNVFCNDYGMHRDGQTFYKIRRMLMDSFCKVIDVEHTNTKEGGWESLNNIVTTIDSGIPVIISVSNQSIKLCHAMLAVGYEKVGDDITRVFLLDPSGDYINVKKRWNAVIEVSKTRKRPFKYNTVTEGIPDSQFVDLDDILIIRRLEE